MILVEASAALETIGFKLRVTDIADQKFFQINLMLEHRSYGV